MNNETAVLIALGLALFIIALVYGFSQGVLSSVENAVLGKNGPGIIDCNPAESNDNCEEATTSESSFQGRKLDMEEASI